MEHCHRAPNRLEQASFPLFVPRDKSFFECTSGGDVIASISPTPYSDCAVCWWDTEPINIRVVRRKSLPVSYKRADNGDVTFRFTGVFCSWECALSFDIHYHRNEHPIMIRIARMHIDNVPMSVPLRQHPLPFVLQKFGGTVSTETFRCWWNLPLSHSIGETTPFATAAMHSVILPELDNVLDATWSMRTSNTVILNDAIPKSHHATAAWSIKKHTLSYANQVRIDMHPCFRTTERAAAVDVDPLSSSPSATSTLSPLLSSTLSLDSFASSASSSVRHAMPCLSNLTQRQGGDRLVTQRQGGDRLVTLMTAEPQYAYSPSCPNTPVAIPPSLQLLQSSSSSSPPKHIGCSSSVMRRIQRKEAQRQQLMQTTATAAAVLRRSRPSSSSSPVTMQR